MNFNKSIIDPKAKEDILYALSYNYITSFQAMQLHPEIIEEAEKNLIGLGYPVDKIVNSDELQKIISEKAKDFKGKEFHSELERLKTEYTTARYNLVNKKGELYEIITNVYKYEKEYLAMKDLLS